VNRSETRWSTLSPWTSIWSGKLFWLILCIGWLGTAAGCDRAYRYMFFPPERQEHTLAPDPDLMYLANDTSYYMSRDSTSIVYDRKTFRSSISPTTS